MTDRLTGIVVRYDVERGYGVVRGDDGIEYYIHYPDLDEAIAPTAGQAVSFLPQPQRKGHFAKQVRRA